MSSMLMRTRLKAVCCLMEWKLLGSTNRLRTSIICTYSLLSNYNLLTRDNIYQSINSTRVLAIKLC